MKIKRLTHACAKYKNVNINKRCVNLLYKKLYTIISFNIIIIQMYVD